ncbi:MAG TPA: pyridoxamine 5'-phosphate oxidase [Acidimicrobiia bacterium]|jgi:pyridoxamine 5'-phosphate oxidase|nr:pyridoxamine 5'-phosphate oxidase [Acidimicrobiia bacterium]
MAELRETDVAADAMAQFRRWYDAAAAAPVEAYDAMVVATASADGAPSARVVLLRGIDDAGFRFYTNYDSAKGRDLAANPRAALVWHWPALGRQVRAVGPVTRLEPSASVEYWRNRPAASRHSAWASRQSEPVADRAALETAAAATAARFADDDVPLPPFWGGYLVTPTSVEFWQHRDDRLHDRLRYERAGDGWTLTRLQP